MLNYQRVFNPSHDPQSGRFLSQLFRMGLHAPDQPEHKLVDQHFEDAIRDVLPADYRNQRTRKPWSDYAA